MQIFTLCFQQFFILQQFFIWEFWSRELPRDEGRANWSTWGKRPTTSPKNLFYLHVRSEKSAVFDGCPLSPSSWLAVNHLPWTRRLLPPVQVQAAATWWLESATLMPWSVKPPHCDQPFMPLLWGWWGGGVEESTWILCVWCVKFWPVQFILFSENVTGQQGVPSRVFMSGATSVATQILSIKQWVVHCQVD